MAIKRRAKKIMVVKTGDPVPAVAQRRGPFLNLIIDSIGPLFHGEYAEVDVRTEDPPDPRGSDAFVITGSSANVPNREAWMLRSEAWLRDVVGVGTPVFGICFGHQLLAQALGGEVTKNPRGREIGSTTLHKTGDDPILHGIPSRFVANVTHIDTVSRRPEGAVSLAHSNADDNHVLRFSPTCYGVQFHPEIDADVMRGYVETRREILANEGFAVDAMLAGIGEGSEGREALRNFVRLFV